MKQSTNFTSDMIQQLHIKMILQGSQPFPTLEESANSLSVPVLGPIPLSPLDQAGRDFHTLYRQEPGMYRDLMRQWLKSRALESDKHKFEPCDLGKYPPSQRHNFLHVDNKRNATYSVAMRINEMLYAALSTDFGTQSRSMNKNCLHKVVLNELSLLLTISTFNRTMK